MIGKVISHYRIIEQLGQGGMGVVYKASDTRLLRSVALKILPPHLVADEKNLLRFTQEARAASALNHPNICTIHETDEHGGIHFIVMEFIDGETLRQILERRGPLPEQEVIDIGMKVADALKAAHAKGIIHRDIKPENIMISREGYVKVMDFGLAKLKDSTTESSWEMVSASSTSARSYRTSVSSFLGTSAYMSPEQIEKKPMDERSDLFSLGLVLYELLTGSPPFAGKDNWEVMQAILQDAPKPPSHFISVNSNALDAPILKALAKDPAARHANSAALFQELEKIQLKRDRKTTRRNLMAMVAVLLLSMIILAIITSGVFKTPTASPPSLKVYPIGLTSETEEWPSFSPDGHHIIYASQSVIKSRGYCYYIKNLTSGVAKFFLPTGYIADWSPDGTSIVYTESTSGIFLTDTSGRNKEKISDFGYCPRWSPDGKRIAFCTQDIGAVAGENAVFLYHLADKKMRQVSPNNGLRFALPDWSPDGRWIVCMGGLGSLWEIWLIEVATGKAQQISDYGTWLRNPVWHPSGAFIYFSSNQNGPFDIWQTPVNLHEGRLQGKPVQLTTGLNVSSMDISPQGDRLVFTREETKASILQIPLARRISPLLQKTKLIMDNLGTTDNLEISPDGKDLVIETQLGGIRSLLIKSLADGTERILYREQPPYAPSWSADGKWIAFDAAGGNNADIFRVPVIGGPAEKIIASPGADWMPTYSPDGKQLCFLSNRSGQFDLWVHHLISGEAIQLTHTPALESRGAWSHNGQKLAYFQDNVPEANCAIWIYDFAAQRAEELLHYPSTKSHVVNKLVWKNDDSALYFLRALPVAH